MNTDQPDLPFNKYRSNTHSQNGEDGIIAEILRRIGIADTVENWCVEFGAWDGKFLSNTFALVERGWNAVYIEGDESRYHELLQTAAKYPKIVPVEAFVARTSTESNSLDTLLQQTKIPVDFGLLSIDIDSYDCDAWESLQSYKPSIVIIEINSSVPPGIVWRHSAKTQGNTFTATLNVGTKKGYTLVCHTGNLVFVRNHLIPAVGLEQRYVDYPELLFQFDNPWLREDLFQSPGEGVPTFIRRSLRSALGKARKAMFSRHATKK